MQPPLTPGNGTASPRFRIGDLEVDIGKAEVTRGDEKIALPKLSFDLLCALINAAPAIITNEELLQQVWPGLLVSPESVAQRVKLLRSVIGDDSQQPRYILGVRGRGYRLIPVVERITDSKLPTGDATNPGTNTASLAQAAAQESATSPPEMPSRWSLGLRRRLGLAVAVFVAIVVIVSGQRIWSSSHHATQSIAVAKVDKSIAVLPFVDMSEKKDQEYFADGMAEEIIDLLANIPGLKVISRTSSFQFKGKTEDLRSIGSQLGVAYVLEGSVRKSGERLRVTAQLINSQDGTNLWSQTYDRDLNDVLKMQDEIAASLGRTLQIEVSVRDIASRSTLQNTDAYTLYLQGLHAIDRTDQPGAEQAVTDFQRSLDLDPSFAAAAEGLAGAYFVLGQWGFMAPGTAFEKCRQAAERALNLDPNLARAHLQLSEVHRAADFDWSAADRELKLAQALAPNDAHVLFIAGVQSQNLGRWDDVVRFASSSLVQDPLDPSAYVLLSLAQLRLGQIADSEAAIRRVLEISPTYTGAHYFLGLVLLARKEPEAALAEMQKELQAVARLGGSAMAFFALGSKAKSDAALAQMLKSHANRPLLISSVYAFRGQLDEALQWLDRAYAQKDPALLLLKSQLAFDKLEGDPRYKAFLKKMNFPE